MRLVTPKCIVQTLDFTSPSDLPRSTGMMQGYYIAYHLVVGDYQAVANRLDVNHLHSSNFADLDLVLLSVTVSSGMIITKSISKH